MKAKPDQFIIANIKICKNPKKKRLSNVNIVPKSLVIVTAWKIMKILLIKGSKNIFVIPVVITLWTVHIWRDTLKEFMKERKSILANFVIKAFLIAIGWGNMLKPYIWKNLMFGTVRRNQNDMVIGQLEWNKIKKLKICRYFISFSMHWLPKILQNLSCKLL